MNTTTGGLGWMYDRDLPLHNLTFARQINARELLERMGVDQNTMAMREQDHFHYELGGHLYTDDGYVVSAGHYRSWAWAWEHGSWKGIEDRGLVPRASIGTAALELPASEKPGAVFRYAEDGRLTTGLGTTDSSLARTGSDPHRFDTEIQALGARPEEYEYGPRGSLGMFYRLAENLGVGLPLDDLNDRPVLSGRLLPPSLAVTAESLNTRAAFPRLGSTGRSADSLEGFDHLDQQRALSFVPISVTSSRMLLEPGWQRRHFSSSR
ncbi:DUF6461 domain-containing protein [Nocardia sp. NBC_00416]|uniref:DUF6461 domain-containing protein n=1 Tax=Nocardia sp. NBC_00416 TaxID=2975991 RepID=UPI002E21CA21